MDRQTGRSSRALVEAHKKYGTFIYVVNTIAAIPYYKELLRSLSIPLHSVNFLSASDINNYAFRGFRFPVVIDHYVYECMLINSEPLKAVTRNNNERWVK